MHSAAGSSGPTQAAVVFAQAQAEEAAGRIEAAVEGYLRALESDPSLRGAQEKVAIFTVAEAPERALELARGLGMNTAAQDILRHLGYVSFRAWSTFGRRERALQALRFWLGVEPVNRDQLLEGADFAAAQGDPELALAIFRRAFARHPGSLYALTGLVRQLQRLGRSGEAKTLIASVVRQAPGQAALRELLASSHANLGEHAEAEAAWNEALRLDAKDLAPHSNLMFSALCRGDLDGEGILRRAQAYGQAIARRRAPDGLAGWRPGPRAAGTARLRVAISSADLCLHPVGFFIAPFLRHRKRDRIELVVLSETRIEDPLAAEMRSLADAWHRTADLAAADYARLVRGLDLDVLIDLSGHTSRHRLLEMSWRLARRQASFLGFAGTIGAPGLDARIVDADTEPPGSERFSAEALLRMEGSYFCFEPHLLAKAAAAAPSPAAAGARLTYGCCAQLGKVSQQAVRLWLRVLSARPDARLLLRCREFAEEGVRQRFAALWRELGGAPEQLALAGWSLGGEHFRLYDEIDVVLNTYPFHLATNICDALWMGVPVVSLLGAEHRSRLGLSISRAAGHAEWCASDEDEFVRIASALGEDPAALAELRANLRSRMLASALCDGAAYAGRLEAAIEALAAG